MAISTTPGHVPEMSFANLDPFNVSLQWALDRIPTYLFRLYAPGSKGTTNLGEVTSAAWGKGCEGIESLLKIRVAELVNCHLWWKQHDADCRLMSWSSSLLFVFQFGFYLHQGGYGRHYKQSLSDLRILVLDTRKFHKGTFIRDLELIEHFKESYSRPGENDLPYMWKMRNGDAYYFGEYLTQGQLMIGGECGHATMKRLVDQGLYKLCPAFRELKKGWAMPVVAMRKGIEYQTPAATTEADVRMAIEAAAVFSGPRSKAGDGDARWIAAVAPQLLSLQKRNYNDQEILSNFYLSSRLSGRTEALLDMECGIEGQGPTRLMVELEQAQSMADAIRDYSRRSRREADDMLTEVWQEFLRMEI
ncbi:hypothetical protein B0T25DRAFT_32588 [Lasiosphaeria hispida]|uniref:DUF7587 domain-containing protein n=1 Tax=Lasiosphaeria hispida TaxID=260671 RepID=A0AAJ0HV22_9PEZI|nr:hypothetical protein B0T25DRAFT_32588 [Lasiosphaeria hispida]